ncbi:hypothetical protein GCM10010170_039300 [Dactylosporangium salmoneum]|uniref:DDE Tnp4 domain-containing protein n=1 Tax=Dactylosporangium salmoneum TaxID=53361 RepID=A0ABP5TD47_9ACTN
MDTDRLAETKISKKGKVIDAWYAGKTHDFGGNVQAVMRPDGLPIWVSQVEPGSAHDLTVARQHALGALYAAAARGLPTLADPGYDGAGIGVHTPVKQPADGRALDVDTRTYNMLLRSLRCLGERGLALLTQRWRALQHVTASPSRIGDFVNAALVLTHFEHRYLGGFNRSSQHLDFGGVRWAGTRSWSGCRRGCGGSGRRTGRCGRRCGRRVGLSPRALCSGSSGG